DRGAPVPARLPLAPGAVGDRAGRPARRSAALRAGEPGMSATKTTLPLDVARRAAERLVTALAPACARIEIASLFPSVIAGSIRRGKLQVGDIELVAIPSVVHAVQRDLFGEVVTVRARDLLDERLEELAQLRAISRTPPAGARPAWG